MPEACVPTQEDVLALLADLGRQAEVGLEAFLDPRPSAREPIRQAALVLGNDRDGLGARTLEVASQWLRRGRVREDAATTARLAAALIRLLRDAGRRDDDVASWMPSAADLRAVDLHGEDLRGVVLRGAVLDDATLHGADLSPDGRELACIGDEGGRIHDLEHGTLRSILASPEGPLEQLEWSPNGRCLACRVGSWLGIWGVEAGAWLGPAEPPWTLHMQRMEARRTRSIAWSPDGRRLAIGGDYDAAVIDVQSAAVVLELTGAEGPLQALAWSPDGKRLAAVVDGGSVPVWSTLDGTLACVLEHEIEPFEPMTSVAWAPHGRVLATASSTAVQTWDADHGRCTLTLRPRGSGCRQVAWSPDGMRLVTSDRDVTLWDATTGALVALLHADGDAWLVSVAGGGFVRGPLRPRAVLEVDQPHGHAYLPAAGILDRPTPALVEDVLGGRPPRALDDAQAQPTEPAWDGGVQRLTWVDEPEDPRPCDPSEG